MMNGIHLDEVILIIKFQKRTVEKFETKFLTRFFLRHFQQERVRPKEVPLPEGSTLWIPIVFRFQQKWIKSKSILNMPSQPTLSAKDSNCSRLTFWSLSIILCASLTSRFNRCQFIVRYPFWSAIRISINPPPIAVAAMRPIFFDA